MIPTYRLIDKGNVAVTRPALERANWLCESCHDDEELRVVEVRSVIKVLCDGCRVRLGSPAVWGGH